MAVTVSVIVPCYNVERALEKCCRSLTTQTYPLERVECLFIDDASNDATARILASFASVPHFRIITHDTNRGLAATRNSGIEQAKGNIILFLDGDMEVPKHWIATLVMGLADADVVAVMGDNQPPPEQILSSFDRYYFGPDRGARQFPPETPLGFQWFLFGNCAIRKTVLDQIGYFDDTFRAYGGEDTDLAIRIAKQFPQGLRFLPAATVIHHHPRTMEDFCRSMTTYGYHNLPLLLEKHPEQTRELGGPWIRSIRGYIVFNPLIRILVRTLRTLYPHGLLTRYLVIAAAIDGARARYRSQALPPE